MLNPQAYSHLHRQPLLAAIGPTGKVKGGAAV